jgi:CO/xanthine dehydrogenase Mo-binding subunit
VDPVSTVAPDKTRLPGNLQLNRRLSQWLTIHADGTVSVTSGKVEIGQGIATALAQIVAEELDIALVRIRMVPASTAGSPNEAVTAGSLSVQDSGSALRLAAAEARAIYLDAAARRLGVSAAELAIDDGTLRVRGSDRHITYWDFADQGLLDRDASGAVAPKVAALHCVVGQPAPRIDLPDKIAGRPRFVHDMTLPGMLYGRVLRPPSTTAELIDVDLAAIQVIAGVVAALRDGRFLGVIAEQEHIAVKALKKLAGVAVWRESASLPDASALPAFLRAQPLETTQVGEKKSDGGQNDLNVGGTKRFGASYSRPYLAHASIGPSCAIARWTTDAACVESLDVWTHSQGIFNLRADLALALALPAEKIVVQHVEGAGCYGHNGADDVAFDAVLLARALPTNLRGRAVQVQWTREDELAWSPVGAAMAVELTASVTADGRIVDWQHQVWSNGHGTRPGRASTPALLAAWHLEKPFPQLLAVNAALAVGGGAERNAIPLYNFAQYRAISHRLLTMPLRTSSLRSLGAHCNVFAAESFIDEIAHDMGVDPLQFRLRHLDDVRGRDVLEAAARMSGWATRVKADDRGMGIAFARYKNTGAYCAAVAMIDAAREVRVTRLWIAVDAGLVINPDGLTNQIEGGAIQTVSWTLKEAVTFDRTRITSNTWETYPILRFSEVPQVAVEIINRPDEKSVGAGEAAQGPVAAAIANAIADALGVRVRAMPLTREAITRAALAD